MQYGQNRCGVERGLSELAGFGALVGIGSAQSGQEGRSDDHQDEGETKQEIKHRGSVLNLQSWGSCLAGRQKAPAIIAEDG